MCSSSSMAVGGGGDASSADGEAGESVITSMTSGVCSSSSMAVGGGGDASSPDCKHTSTRAVPPP